MLIALVGLTAAMCSAVSAAPAAWPLAGSTPAWPLQHVKNLQSSATVTYTTTDATGTSPSNQAQRTSIPW